MRLRKAIFIGQGEDKKEIRELDLDFERLRVQDIYEAEENAVKSGVVVQYFELNKTIQWSIVAKAAGIPIYLDTDLHPLDFIELCREAQLFLMGIDQEESLEDNF